MTDAELRDEIAVKVFGTAMPADYPHDMNAAIQVAEKMRERGWFLKLLSPMDYDTVMWYAGFTRIGSAGEHGRPDHDAAEGNPARAICRAALRAIDTERP